MAGLAFETESCELQQHLQVIQGRLVVLVHYRKEEKQGTSSELDVPVWVLMERISEVSVGYVRLRN